MAHKYHSTYLQDIPVLSYFSSCRLICELYCPISAHVVLFASCIILLQFMSSYCRLCYLVVTHTILFTAYILLFSSYIILFQASTSSYSHSKHHPIYSWYYNLFANIIPPYLHLFWSFVLFFDPKNLLCYFWKYAFTRS